MKEYITPIYDEEQDWDEMFVGAIRKQDELIRCKDCRWHWRVTEFRTSGYCENDKCFDGFHFETNNDFYCGYAERKEE